jgi:G3E family GTPase
VYLTTLLTALIIKIVESLTAKYRDSPTSAIRSQAQQINPSAQILTQDADDVFELRNSHDQQLTKDEVEEIRKKSALEEVEEPEGKTTAFSKFTERLGIDAAPKRCLTVLIRKTDCSKNQIRNYTDACPLCRYS